MFCINGAIDISKHLDYYLKSIKSQTVLLLGSNNCLMLTLLEFTLSNLRQRINHPLQNIFLLAVTIVVVEDFQYLMCVLWNLVEYIQDKILVMIDRVSRVKDPQKDLLQENNYFLLKMLPEIFEDAVEYWERETKYSLFIGYALLQKKLT